MDENLPTGNSNELIEEKSSREQTLEFIVFISALGIFFVGIELIKSRDK